MWASPMAPNVWNVNCWVTLWSRTFDTAHNAVMAAKVGIQGVRATRRAVSARLKADGRAQRQHGLDWRAATAASAASSATMACIMAAVRTNAGRDPRRRLRTAACTDLRGRLRRAAVARVDPKGASACASPSASSANRTATEGLAGPHTEGLESGSTWDLPCATEGLPGPHTDGLDSASTWELPCTTEVLAGGQVSAREMAEGALSLCTAVEAMDSPSVHFSTDSFCFSLSESDASGLSQVAGCGCGTGSRGASWMETVTANRQTRTQTSTHKGAFKFPGSTWDTTADETMGTTAMSFIAAWPAANTELRRSGVV
mmetsp:Transcript_42830/g.129398  ORF Transcript_42830/g.129398 Transcript_42830/m.129398 type:complete len:315 (+) Transcript_42830:515-1459(+)